MCVAGVSESVKILVEIFHRLEKTRECLNVQHPNQVQRKNQNQNAELIQSSAFRFSVC